VRAEVSRDAEAVPVPPFALQTLVENAVRHGAAPRVDPTEITVTARLAGDLLTVEVRDTGAGAEPAALAGVPGTGLSRLRERLATIYGSRARLDLVAAPGAGFTATLTIPREAAG
jgi:LytS/YehU family sensor histidine kinase